MGVRPADSTGAPIQPPNPSAPPRSQQVIVNMGGTTGTEVPRPAQGVNRPVADGDMARYKSR